MEIKGILTSNLIAIAKEAIHGNDRPCLLALKGCCFDVLFPENYKTVCCLGRSSDFSLPGEPSRREPVA